MHLNPLGHKVIGETIFKNMKKYRNIHTRKTE